jgi:DNA-binding PadR family transcriptional regulator
MARSLPTSSYAVLGLLSLAPMSGYELAQSVNRSIAHFWPMSKTQVYSELGRLDSLGLVEGTAVEQDRLPDKRVFQITDQGCRVLDDWLSSPQPEASTYRIPTLVKLFFSHRIDRGRLAALLDDFEAHVKAEVEVMGPVTEMLAGVPKARHAWAAALYGLRLSEACLAWVGEVRGTLDEPSAASERRSADDPVGDSELVRQLLASAPPVKRRSEKRA